jgi:hypothetical protein
MTALAEHGPITLDISGPNGTHEFSMRYSPECDRMSLSATLGILFFAALLEAGGDALVRSGLGASALPIRWACFAARDAPLQLSMRASG